MRNYQLPPLFGVAYCPYAKSGDIPQEYFARDLETMKKLHINVIRPFIAWDRIEIRKDVFDYSLPDRIFREAERLDMKILLNFGGALSSYAGTYPPRYLLREPGIQEAVFFPGEQSRQFGPARQLCLDDPLYHDRAMAFIRQTILRYRDSPSLIAWNLWNEPFYRHFGCCCPLSLKLFRQFLRERYDDDIDKLNARWGTEFPVFYESFDEVEPGTQVSFTGGGYVPCIDFLIFNRLQIVRRLEEIKKLVRRYDPLNRPVTVNVAVTGAYGKYAEQHGFPSIFEQNRCVDIPGFSAYNHIAMLEGDDPCLTACADAWIRSAGTAPDEGFWAVESEAGQMSCRNSHHAIAEKGWRMAANWQMVAQGAKMLMFWKFGGRNTDTQTTGFNLCGYDGSITGRARLMADFAEQFFRLQEYWLEGKVKAEMAVYISSATEHATIVDRTYPAFTDGIYGAFRTAVRLHRACDLLDDHLLLSSRLLKYRLLLIPGATFITEKAADRLKSFVEQGGILITDRTFGMKNEFSMHFQTIPGHGLQSICGAFINDDDFAECPEYIETGEEKIMDISDCLHSVLHLQGAEELAVYSEGGCALSVHTAGKGKVYCWGIDLFQQLQTHKDGQEKVYRLLAGILKDAGIAEDLQVSGDDHSQLQTGVLHLPDQSRTYFLINFSGKELNCSITFPEPGEYLSLLDSRICCQSLDLQLEPYETAVFHRR